MRMKLWLYLILSVCFMLAVGFLYYSSWRISLRVWVHKSLYDEQGFLLKLDGTLSLELTYKYGNLSKGACKPGFAAAKMTAIYPKFNKLAPVFLDLNYKRFAKIGDYPPPFGVKSQERIIDHLLSVTKNYGLGENLDIISCKTCIIMGNGGILINKSLGQQIDGFDVVVRLNQAPVKGYEKDVGSKTTLRITYPEGAIQKIDQYEDQSLFVLSAFKAQDFKWLRYMVFKQGLHNTNGFWKSVARHVPREASDMRILNPYFIQEASFQLIGFPHNNGQMGKGSWTHNIIKENKFLRKLHQTRKPRNKKTCQRAPGSSPPLQTDTVKTLHCQDHQQWMMGHQDQFTCC
ncbi:ST3 beta-galactoside alpha-2,3-sialyltransferase 3a isoform X4 [Betta splendens]|uniref:ST3 beta-galactoside alpha-2,3-sialyltransferase 3a isoform X4 n=1 Tax=Betta splendens TaxID=158456 RepID=A0A8M1HCD7_BETSP|nr:ST3 beta-galactoside alpha-2,3-sialyltransferase 3a isoform X4 [Betta splendens]